MILLRLFLLLFLYMLYPKHTDKETPANQIRPKSGVFDHERLEIYKMELEFIKWVPPLIEDSAKSATGRPREVCDQLDRASLSSLLNTAEGNGKRQRPVRAKFFDDARGSATESAGCLDALVAKGIVGDDRIAHGKAMLLQIVCMLSGLVDRFDDSVRLREEPLEYRVSATEEEQNTRESKRKRQTKV